MAIVANIDMLMVRRNLARGWKKRVLKEQLLLWRKIKSKVVHLTIQIQRNLFYGKLENWDWTLRRDTPWKFSGRTSYQTLNRERKGPSQGVIQKCEPHERNPCARKFEDRTPEETSKQEDRARTAAWDLPKNVYELKSEEKNCVLFSCESKIRTGAHLQKSRRSYVCCRFGSSNAHAEQERFKLIWNWYFAKIQKPDDCGDRKWGRANKRGSTSARSRSWFTRDGATTRRNASSSIAW